MRAQRAEPTQTFIFTKNSTTIPATLIWNLIILLSIVSELLFHDLGVVWGLTDPSSTGYYYSQNISATIPVPLI